MAGKGKSMSGKTTIRAGLGAFAGAILAGVGLGVLGETISYYPPGERFLLAFHLDGGWIIGGNFRWGGGRGLGIARKTQEHNYWHFDRGQHWFISRLGVWVRCRFMGSRFEAQCTPHSLGDFFWSGNRLSPWWNSWILDPRVADRKRNFSFPKTLRTRT